MIPHGVPEWNCLVTMQAPTVHWLLAIGDLLFVTGVCIVNLTVMYAELRAWRAHEKLVKRRTPTVLGITLRQTFAFICVCEIFFWIRSVVCSQFLTMNSNLTQCIIPVVLARMVRWVWDIAKMAFILESTHDVTSHGERKKLSLNKELGLLFGIWIAGIVLSLTQVINGAYDFQRNIIFIISPVYNTCIFWIHVVMSFSVLIYSSLKLDKAKKDAKRSGMPRECILQITDVYGFLKRIIAADLMHYALNIVTDVCFALGLSRNAWVTCVAKLNTNAMLTYETFLCASINSPSKLTEKPSEPSRPISESREELMMEPINSEVVTTDV